MVHNAVDNGIVCGEYILYNIWSAKKMGGMKEDAKEEVEGREEEEEEGGESSFLGQPQHNVSCWSTAGYGGIIWELMAHPIGLQGLSFSPKGVGGEERGVACPEPEVGVQGRLVSMGGRGWERREEEEGRRRRVGLGGEGEGEGSSEPPVRPPRGGNSSGARVGWRGGGRSLWGRREGLSSAACRWDGERGECRGRRREKRAEYACAGRR